MRCKVRLCQRRFVILALNVEVARVDFENRITGPFGKCDGGFDEFDIIHSSTFIG